MPPSTRRSSVHALATTAVEIRAGAGRRCKPAQVQEVAHDALQHVRASRPTTTRQRCGPVGMVVDGQLLTCINSAGRAKEDGVPDNRAVAVGRTRMVEKPSVIAPNTPVNRPTLVDLKTPDSAGSQLSGLTSLTLRGCDLLTGIVDDAAVLVDRLQSEHTPSVQSRPALSQTRTIWDPGNRDGHGGDSLRFGVGRRGHGIIIRRHERLVSRTTPDAVTGRNRPAQSR